MNGSSSSKRRHEMMPSFSNRRPPSPHNSPPFRDDGYFDANRKRTASHMHHTPGRYTSHSSDYPPPYTSRHNHSPPSSNMFPDDISYSPSKVITLPYSLLIPNELIGFLIGSGGSCIKEIENASSSILYFEKSGRTPKAASPSNTNILNDSQSYNSPSHNPQNPSQDEDKEEITDKILSIYGSQEQKNHGVNLILSRIRSISTLQDFDQKDAIIICLPIKSLPLLIGHKGMTINGLTHRSGCQIYVQKQTTKNDQIKAVSIRSSHISGLVNCISMIYETFEEFIYQGKLQAEHFLIMKDEKSTKYFRDTCAAATAMANRRKQSSHGSPINYPPFSSDDHYHPYDRKSPRSHKRQMVNSHPDAPHNNHGNMPYPLDEPNKPYIRDGPSYSSSNHKSHDSHFRNNSPENYPPQHHMFRDDNYEPYSSRMNQFYHDFQDSERGFDSKNMQRSFSDYRKKDHYYQQLDNNRFNPKDDHIGGMSNMMMPGGPKSSDSSSLHSYGSHMPNNNYRGFEHTPMNHMKGEGNLLMHQFSEHPTPFHIKFIITFDTAAWLVGKRGDHIKEAKRITGADISVSDQKSSIEGLEPDERLLTISGSIQSKYRVYQVLISTMLSKYATPNKTIKMLLPLKSVSFVIGYRGLTINQITHESAAEVNFDKNAILDGDRPVTITGNPASQLTASLLLFEKVEEYYNPDIAAQKLHLPLIQLSSKPLYNNTHSTNSGPHNNPNSQHNNPSSQHNNPSSQHGNPSSQHNNPSSQHSNLGSQHNNPGPQHNNPSSQHNNPSSHHTPILHHTSSSSHHTPSSSHHAASSSHHTPSLEGNDSHENSRPSYYI